MAFSPDGNYIVSGSYDNTIRIWDLKGNQIDNFFFDHRSGIRSVAFSPDGKYIVSGSNDNTLRLWDLKDNQIGNLLKSGCNQLKDHPVLKNPQTNTQKEAQTTCFKYAYWKNLDSESSQNYRSYKR